MQLTPVEYIDGVYVKRDDLFTFAGVNGVKARSVLHILRQVQHTHYNGIVTAGVRNSSQCIVVANIARAYGVPCLCFVPKGKITPEIIEMQNAGAQVVQVPYGYKSVVNARAREKAQELDYVFIPHSLETELGIEPTAEQVQNVPSDARRIVVPCGSGMTLAGVLQGVKRYGVKITVLGVAVGGKVEPRLNKFAPSDWQDYCSVVYSDYKYEKEAPNKLGDLIVDPIYEAKALPYLQDSDLLWVTGLRKTLVEEDVNGR